MACPYISSGISGANVTIRVNAVDHVDRRHFVTMPTVQPARGLDRVSMLLGSPDSFAWPSLGLLSNVNRNSHNKAPVEAGSLTQLDRLLAHVESRRLIVLGVSALIILAIVWADWEVQDTSVGFLYLIPVLLASAALRRGEILFMAALCGYLMEAFDPLQSPGAQTPAPVVVNPFHWVAGSFGRFTVVSVGFAMTGFFLSHVNQRRRLLAAHLADRERQINLRQEAEQQLQTLMETSPLAILTLDQSGRIVLSNESARQLLGFEKTQLQGEEVEPYLPILPRMLHNHSHGHVRTHLECKGHRRNGEAFLAHLWLSTYRSSQRPGLAVVAWDASENLRDREGAELDSMMETSRVLIGAMSHEIRNLASAAISAYTELGETEHIEQYHALGSLLQGMSKVATSGLRFASTRGLLVADLGTVLDEARIVVEPTLKETGIKAAWQINADLPLVQADHHSLLQAFLNLIRNSVRALETSQCREVCVTACVERDLVVVRFQDTGPGVDHPEELFKAFQPGAHSTGLGLYIARAILRFHGGDLRYQGDENGSCFLVELWPAEDSRDR